MLRGGHKQCVVRPGLFCCCFLEYNGSSPAWARCAGVFVPRVHATGTRLLLPAPLRPIVIIAIHRRGSSDSEPMPSGSATPDSRSCESCRDRVYRCARSRGRSHVVVVRVRSTRWRRSVVWITIIRHAHAWLGIILAEYYEELGLVGSLPSLMRCSVSPSCVTRSQQHRDQGIGMHTFARALTAAIAERAGVK